LVNFNPRDTSLFVDGRVAEIFSRLRESETLSVDSNGVVPIYSLVRYKDIAWAYREPETFSPSAGLTLDSFDPARSKSLSKMLETAPPRRHRELRSAMQGAFREPNLSRLAAATKGLLDRFLADSVAGGVIDFVESFARKAASTTINDVLGVAPTEATRLDPLLRAIAEIDVGVPPQSASPVTDRGTTELWLLRELIRIVRTHRAEQRSEGLIGILLGASIAEQSLTDHEIALNCLNVVVAGTGASQHALSGAAAVWTERSADLARVACDPGLAQGLIDETLRWLTPVVHLTRFVTRDVEVSGQEVPQGSGVCLWNVSANRDEEIFDEADAFRLDRPPRRHLAFGVGPQHCLGAQIVRVQLGVLLNGMLARGVRLELGGRPAWIRSNAIAGVERLPVHVRRASDEPTAK
jgi:cytochrome P450